MEEQAVHDYFSGVAEARFAIRKVFRIVDDKARDFGLDPLEHQALIQIHGSGDEMLQVNNVAARLDIAPAFASRVVRQLEDKEFVERRPSTQDRRVIEVHMTDPGRAVLKEIDGAVRVDVEYFQQQLSSESKATALSIMGFYIGVHVDRDAALELAQGPTRE